METHEQAMKIHGHRWELKKIKVKQSKSLKIHLWARSYILCVCSLIVTVFLPLWALPWSYIICVRSLYRRCFPSSVGPWSYILCVRFRYCHPFPPYVGPSSYILGVRCLYCRHCPPSVGPWSFILCARSPYCHHVPASVGPSSIELWVIWKDQRIPTEINEH